MIASLILAQTALSVRIPDKDFITVPAGTYSVGATDNGNNPLRKVTLKSFQVSKYEVTNAQFAAFVRATGYKTDAEKNHMGMVFQPPLPEFQWIHDKTAMWRWPNGKSRGGILEKMNHPVVSISYRDAQAFCRWAKVRLPSLEEWEVACRAGTTTKWFFGDDPSLIWRYANIWYGRNHQSWDKSDGYGLTSPVGSFKPNPWGLFDVYGNVFELCEGHIPGERNPDLVHARGGSWWCSKNSCGFFNSEDIGIIHKTASFSNQGFRVAR